MGSHLVDSLLEQGERVRVLDNLDSLAHPGGGPAHLDPAAELIAGDLRDRTTVERALERVDRVFHLGGVVGNGESMVNVRRAVDLQRGRDRHAARGRRRAPRQGPAAGGGLLDGGLRRGRLPLSRARAHPSGAAPGRAAAPSRLGAALSGLRRTGHARANPRERAPAADQRVRGDKARPGGARADPGPRLRARDRGPALPQRLRPAPGAVQSLHRRGGHLRRACAQRTAAAGVRGRRAAARPRARIRRRERHPGGDGRAGGARATRSTWPPARG